jgi:hypothetical protein
LPDVSNGKWHSLALFNSQNCIVASKYFDHVESLIRRHAHAMNYSVEALIDYKCVWDLSKADCLAVLAREMNKILKHRQLT